MLHPDEVARFTGLVTASMFPLLIKLLFAPHHRRKTLLSNPSLPVLRKILNDKTVSGFCLKLPFEIRTWKLLNCLLLKWVRPQCCAGQLTFHSFQNFMRQLQWAPTVCKVLCFYLSVCFFLSKPACTLLKSLWSELRKVSQHQPHTVMIPNLV